ncbi:hypothetical protein D3C84_995100 [compost metagenome]
MKRQAVISTGFSYFAIKFAAGTAEPAGVVVDAVSFEPSELQAESTNNPAAERITADFALSLFLM